MIKTYLVFVLCLISSFSQALTLDGDWKSDKERTLKWNRENRKTTDEYLEEIGKILGHSHLVFSENRICSYLEPFKINGKNNGGFAMPESSYKIIAKNKHGFVIEQTLSTNEKTIFMLIFESEDTFYGVNLDTEDYGREYYSREKSSVNAKWGQKTCYPLQKDS